ncbi:HAD family hydrolase [Streptomyces sp. G7(2002)]|uniref:HAD family hydrolase n=1 Tax=Streptomyces sp. G7(2002) TaxID=2971798 RepID=UPI00237E26D2|nr:HAD family phosphatase [Streptomyces sp. G7(2002)]WDT53531.1 HAD family phosphatase [Streptomyces sp. G7(2002)]
MNPGDAMPPYEAVIFDFGGVLTTSLDDCARAFARRSGLPDDAYLHAVTVNPVGRHLFAQLERGDITQESWNEGIAQLLGIDGTDLMRRALTPLKPEASMVEAARAIRAAGLRTAVLSNSMGMSPFNIYEPWKLEDEHDVVVLSEQVGMRKPDPEIYQLTLRQLGCRGPACIFVDDIEANLRPAQDLGITTIHAQQPDQTLLRLGEFLGLPIAAL